MNCLPTIALITFLSATACVAASEPECVAANAVGKTIYGRAYAMSAASRDQQALTATQDFWALHEHFASCSEIIRIATALRTSGFGPEKKPETTRLINFSSGSSSGSASGKYDSAGFPTAGGGAKFAEKPKNSLLVDGIEYVPLFKSDTVKLNDATAREQAKAEFKK